MERMGSFGSSLASTTGGGSIEHLLESDEEPVVEIRAGNGPLVLVCEHASNRLPRALGALGLSGADLARHIAWDPGAAELAESIARTLDATLVTQRYSRLAVDCNRDPVLPDAITDRSENTIIPGNAGLTEQDRALRVRSIWEPFHAALSRLLDERKDARRPTALATVHSFTPIYLGVARPWHIGIISTEERTLADSMLRVLRQQPGLVVGDNEPYSAKDNVDYTIRRHGRAPAPPPPPIEIRNDLLATAGGQHEWTARLSGLLGAFDMSTVADVRAEARNGTTS